MDIKEIKSTIVIKNAEKLAAKVTNPQVTANQEQKEIINDKGAQALKNYFLGAQNIPSFKGFDCSTGEFNRNMMYVPCACCGKEMINGGDNAEKLANKFSAVKGEERLQFIDENMKVFRPVEKTIARALKIEAEKYPEKRTNELISIIARKSEEVLKQGQLTVLDEVDAKAKEHYGENNQVSKFLKTQKPLITGKENSRTFSRAKFVAQMNTITTKLKNEEAKGHVLNTAIDMPFEKDFFKRMIKDATNPHKFIRCMFINAVKTAEHIHPKSLGGPNNTGNYMSECNECNENRQNYDLNTYWQARYPSMPYNVQRYANTVTGQVIDGKIGPKFVDYPKDLKIAVEKETKGEIKLKVLNPEEINKKRAEKGLEPLPLPIAKKETTPNTEKAA